MKSTSSTVAIAWESSGKFAKFKSMHLDVGLNRAGDWTRLDRPCTIHID